MNAGLLFLGVSTSVAVTLGTADYFIRRHFARNRVAPVVDLDMHRALKAHPAGKGHVQVRGVK